MTKAERLAMSNEVKDAVDVVMATWIGEQRAKGVAPQDAGLAGGRALMHVGYLMICTALKVQEENRTPLFNEFMQDIVRHSNHRG